MTLAPYPCTPDHQPDCWHQDNPGADRCQAMAVTDGPHVRCFLGADHFGSRQDGWHKALQRADGLILAFTERDAVYPEPYADVPREPWDAPLVNPNRVTYVGEGGTETLRPQKARDTQVGGNHYLNRAIQLWDIIEVWDLDYFRGSTLKYLLRAGSKGSALEDLKKAQHYLSQVIEIEEKKKEAE